MKVVAYLKQGVAFTNGVRGIWYFHSVVSLLHILMSLWFVFVCKHLIDIATERVAGDLSPWVIVLLTVVGLQIALSAAKNGLGAYCEIRIKNSLRAVCFTHLMYSRNLSRKVHTGEVVNRLDEDVQRVAEAIGRTVPAVMATFVQFLLAFYYLCRLEASLAWVLVLIMPVCLWLSKWIVKRMKTQALEIRQEEGRMQTFLQEHIQHITLLQTLQQEQRAGKLLQTAQNQLYGKVIRQTRFQVLSRVLVSGAFALGYVVAFVWGVQGIAAGNISFGMMTAFLQLTAQIQNPLLEMSRRLPSLVYAIASVDRLMELKVVGEKESSGRAVVFRSPIGVSFQNVEFTYPDGEYPVLRDFSYDFQPGSRTAVLGESGIGKSTLIRLLLALYTPQQGGIYLYDTEHRIQVDASLRSCLVYVPQGNTLLSGTIRDNLLLGNPNASEEQLKEVLRIAVADFVELLPRGLDTPCSELGGGLSEGQAQRIAIARSLLKDGGVFLFDEITASLDAETERQLVENLMTHYPDRTMIFITHRPYILSHCTQILQIKGSDY